MGTLEERAKEKGISLEKPTEGNYVYGDLTVSGLSKEEAEDNLLEKAATLGVTNAVDWRYRLRPLKVTATVYRPKPQPEQPSVA